MGSVVGFVRMVRLRRDAEEMQPWRCTGCGRAVRKGRGDPCWCTGGLEASMTNATTNNLEQARTALTTASVARRQAQALHSERLSNLSARALSIANTQLAAAIGEVTRQTALAALTAVPQ